MHHVCVCVYTHVYHGIHAEVREQLLESESLHSLISGCWSSRLGLLSGRARDRTQIIAVLVDIVSCDNAPLHID